MNNSDQTLKRRRGGQSSRANPDLAQRLKFAIQTGGGNKIVAERSGVKLASLNNYIRLVNAVPADAVTAIAKACGVSVQWVLTGEGSMHPTEMEYQELASLMAPQRPEPHEFSAIGGSSCGTLESTLDLARLGAAIRIAQRRHIAPDTAEQWLAMAREVAALYDILTDQAAGKDASENPLSAQ